MKRLLMIGLMGLIFSGQWSVVSGQGSKMPRPTLHTVNFVGHHGESFSVFFDGDLMNRMPQGRVMVNDVTDRTHEVVVVLRRPAQKAAVLRLLPGESSVVVNVIYDERTDELSLYTPLHNRAEQREPVPPIPAAQATLMEEPPLPPPVVPVKPVSNADVDAMVTRMKGQTFDSDRLALGKVIVASSYLTASQITRLAETIDYSSSQVEFLKYAYRYCIDKQNYYTTVDILTFSSDKKKVMDYIATQ